MKSTERSVTESGFAASARAPAGCNARRARKRLVADAGLLAACALLFLPVSAQSKEWTADVLPVGPGRDFPESDRAPGAAPALSRQRGSRAARQPSPAEQDELPAVFRKAKPESLDDLKAIERQVKKIVHRVITHPAASAKFKSKVDLVLRPALKRLRREDSILLPQSGRMRT